MKSTDTNKRSPMLDTHTIDYIIQHLPYDCRRNVRSGYHYVALTPTGLQVRHAYCHTLRCRTCVRVRFNTMFEALHRAYFLHHLAFFVSLTLPRVSNPAALLQRSAGRFLTEARRTFGPLQYFWVVGVGHSRNPHLHLLVDRDLSRAAHYGSDRAWLRPTWHRLTGGHQTDLQPITLGTERRVINYMLTDMFGSVLSDLPIRHRYGSSRAIHPNPKPTFVRNPDAPRYRRREGSSGSIARELGLEEEPFMNGDFLFDPKAPKVRSLPVPSRVESPLCAGCEAAGAPAGGRDVVDRPTGSLT